MGLRALEFKKKVDKLVLEVTCNMEYTEKIMKKLFFYIFFFFNLFAQPLLFPVKSAALDNQFVWIGGAENKLILKKPVSQLKEICNSANELKSKVSSVVEEFVCGLKKIPGLAKPIISHPKIDLVRQWWLNKFSNKNALLPKEYKCGKLIKLKTDDDYEFEATFHDRGGKYLVIVCHQFNSFQEEACRALWLFDDADVLTFDFRGHGKNRVRRLLSSLFTLRVDFQTFQFGKKEELEIKSAVEYCKKQRENDPYQKVVGLGFCFGAAMLAKAQALYPDLFTHLILESCWPKMDILLDRFLGYPRLATLPNDPNYRQKNSRLKKFFGNKKIKKTLKIILERILCKQKIDFSICPLDYLKKVKIPVMFSHGNNDNLIKFSEFESMWKALDNNLKVAFVTNDGHIVNSRKNKFLFKTIANLFVNSQPEDFINKFVNDRSNIESISCNLSPELGVSLQDSKKNNVT